MITLLTILAVIFVAVLLAELVLFLLSTCWWLGIIVAIGIVLGWIDWLVIKHGWKKLFGEKED